MIYLHGSTGVWESLTRFDDNMDPQMMLAKSFEQSQDGKTWTIQLREGVKFHDGTDLNAEVAVYNLNRNYHWNTAKKAYDETFANTGEFGTISEMKVVNPLTFTVTHEEAIPDFPSRMAYDNAAIFALASFDENRAIVHPYGTGPYRYDGYDEQQQIVTLSKFTGYYLGEPKLDFVTFQNIADATTRLAALQSGEIDVISDVGGILPHQAAQVQGDSNLVLKERMVSTTHYYFVNTTEGKLFSDQRMREALSLSIDRDTIVNSLLLGYGQSAVSVLSCENKTFVTDCGYTFDPEAAKALVEEAGKEKPSCVILINSSMTGRWPYADVAVMIQAQLQEIGVNAQIETVDAATWNQRLKDGDYDIAPQPFTVSCGEPNFFFIRNVLSAGSNNKARNYGINDASLDALIQQVAVESDLSERIRLYQELQKAVFEKQYIIPVWYDMTLYAMNRSVTGFDLDVVFCPNLFEVDLAR